MYPSGFVRWRTAQAKCTKALEGSTVASASNTSGKASSACTAASKHAAANAFVGPGSKRTGPCGHFPTTTQSAGPCAIGSEMARVRESGTRAWGQEEDTQDSPRVETTSAKGAPGQTKHS